VPESFDGKFVGVKPEGDVLKFVSSESYANSSRELVKLLERDVKNIEFKNILEKCVLDQKNLPGPDWSPYPQEVVEKNGLEGTAKSPEVALPSGVLKPTTFVESVDIANKELVRKVCGVNAENVGVLLEKETKYFAGDKYDVKVVNVESVEGDYDCVFSFGSIEKQDPYDLIKTLNNTTKRFSGYYLDLNHFFDKELKIDEKSSLLWKDKELKLCVKGSNERTVASMGLYKFLDLAETNGWNIKITKGIGYSTHPEITNGYFYFEMIRDGNGLGKLNWREIGGSIVFEDWNEVCEDDCVVIDSDKNVLFKTDLESCKLLVRHNSKFHRVIVSVGNVRITHFPTFSSSFSSSFPSFS
jgi:hypothetical protein